MVEINEEDDECGWNSVKYWIKALREAQLSRERFSINILSLSFHSLLVGFL
jgi:hypothetical protein